MKYKAFMRIISQMIMQEFTTVTVIEKARHHVSGLKGLKLRMDEPIVTIFSNKTVDRSL